MSYLIRLFFFFFFHKAANIILLMVLSMDENLENVQMMISFCGLHLVVLVIFIQKNDFFLPL